MVVKDRAQRFTETNFRKKLIFQTKISLDSIPIKFLEELITYN
jgi:hypothetical protein